MTRQIGLVRWFADFSLLPDLLALRRDGARPLESWAELLADRGASLDHVDEEESIEQGTMWTLMAKDAWDLCERLGLLEFGPPASRVAIAARLGEELPRRIQDAGRGHGWAPIVDTASGRCGQGGGRRRQVGGRLPRPAAMRVHAHRWAGPSQWRGGGGEVRQRAAPSARRSGPLRGAGGPGRQDDAAHQPGGLRRRGGPAAQQRGGRRGPGPSRHVRDRGQGDGDAPDARGADARGLPGRAGELPRGHAAAGAAAVALSAGAHSWRRDHLGSGRRRGRQGGQAAQALG